MLTFYWGGISDLVIAWLVGTSDKSVKIINCFLKKASPEVELKSSRFCSRRNNDE